MNTQCGLINTVNADTCPKLTSIRMLQSIFYSVPCLTHFSHINQPSVFIKPRSEDQKDDSRCDLLVLSKPFDLENKLLQHPAHCTREQSSSDPNHLISYSYFCTGFALASKSPVCRSLATDEIIEIFMKRLQFYFNTCQS